MRLEDLEYALQKECRARRFLYCSISQGSPAFLTLSEKFDPAYMDTWPVAPSVLASLFTQRMTRMRTDRIEATIRLLSARCVDWFSSPDRQVAYDTRMLDARTWPESLRGHLGRDSEGIHPGEVRSFGIEHLRPWWTDAVLALPIDEVDLVEVHSKNVLRATLVVQQSAGLPMTSALGRTHLALRDLEQSLAKKHHLDGAGIEIAGNYQSGFILTGAGREPINLDPAACDLYDSLQIERRNLRPKADQERTALRQKIDTEIESGEHDLLLPDFARIRKVLELPPLVGNPTLDGQGLYKIPGSS